jgi:hypothetical protein
MTGSWTPRVGAAGYEQVGLALLVAATPPEVGPDYNARRGALWARCQALRTVPTTDEFENELHELRDLLRAVAESRRVVCDEARYAELVRAARRLDAVAVAVVDAGPRP